MTASHTRDYVRHDRVPRITCVHERRACGRKAGACTRVAEHRLDAHHDAVHRAPNYGCDASGLELAVGIDTVRNHHGQPAHQGLDNHRTEVFGVRRQNKQFCVHKSGQFQLVTYDPRKYNPIRHTELCRHLPHCAS